jgi:PAS domain S-box-containing protein
MWKFETPQNMHSFYPENRKSGLALIDDLPWGSSFCWFFQTGKDLVDVLVPYFKAGLESNEFCLWVTSRPIAVKDARKELRKALPQFDEYESKGQIEIIPYSRMGSRYGKSGDAIFSMLDKGLSNGFDGLRFSCIARPDGKGGKALTSYGVDAVSRYDAIAAYAYPRDKFDAAGLMEVVNRHRFALVRNADEWEVIKGLEARVFKDAIKRTEEKLQLLFSNMSEGFAYHRIVLNSEGQPCDYVFLEVNESFEKLTGLTAKKIIGKRATEVLPGIENDPADWIGKYGKVALTGEPVQFESYSERIGRWGSVSAFSSHKGYFAVTLGDITERKRMEEELRKSRDNLELHVQERTKELIAANEALSERAEIIDLAHDAILVRDGENRITFWSRGAKETYGYTRQEAIGQVSNELLKTAYPVPLENIEKTVVEKGEWKGELKHTNAKGERIIVDSRWAVHAGKDGSAGFLEVNRDITARRIAEEEFRKVDRAFRTLSEYNQAMVGQTNEMKLFRQACRIVVDVGGYRMAWVGFAMDDEEKTVLPIAFAGYDEGYLDQTRITWADVEMGRGPCGTSIRTGKMAVSQNTFSNPAFAPWRTEAARRGYASCISLPLVEEDNVIGALGIFAAEPDAFDQGESSLLSDLAENLSYGVQSIRSAERRRRAEEAVSAERKRLFDVLETLPPMICLLTRDYHVAFANRSFRKKFGESDGRHCYEYCFGRDAPCDFCESYNVLRTGQPHHWEVTGPDGSVIDVYDFPFIDVDGSPMILEMDIDITDRRRAEAELSATIARLELTNNELREFAFIAAHDLQEPLRKIQTFCDLTMKRCATALGAPGLEYLDRVIECASRMRDLLRSLLQFSKIVADRESFKQIEFDSVVRKAADLLEVSIQESGCRIEIDNLPAVEADQSQVIHLFQNLIGNALKFRGDRTPHIKIYSKSDQKGTCEIFVEDNGIGFEQQFAELIFKPFQRLHRSEYDGTGMGLSICRKIVERHGGSIRVESEPGKGSTFIIRLPIKQTRFEQIGAR